MSRGRRALALAALLLAASASTASAAPSRPDLRVTKAAATPKAVAPGARVSVTFTVANRGRVKAKKSAVAIVLSTNAKLDKRDVRLATRSQKALKQRKRGAGKATVTIPRATAARRYRLLVCADARNAVRESSERNNCRAAATLDVRTSRTPQPQPAQPQPPAPQPAAPQPLPSGPSGPTVTITSAPAAVTGARTATFSFTGATECRLDDAPFAPCTSPVSYTDLLGGEHVFEARAGATTARHAWRIEFEAPAPGPAPPPAPNPATQATPATDSEPTLVNEATKFLYTGPNPIQRDVAPDAVKPLQASVLRGRVLRRNGSPVEGVEVSVHDQPQLGRTATRADGGYDIAVNGGGPVTLTYKRAGYIPAQREIDVRTLDYGAVDDVVLVPDDDRVSGVDLTKPELQVAKSTTVTDADGSRAATLLLEPDTTARATLPDGTTKDLGDRLNIRATEFTIGESGPAAMPGELPPTSAYTYAVEYSVDEADAEDAVDVRFDKPVVTYVDNYLGFPVGTAVPMGYYDRAKAQWIASRDGRVIKLVAGGVDTDGDGVADNQGIDAAERAKLAQLYAAGTELWRAEIDHFTPWDYNWPYGLPDGAEGPDGDDPDGDDPPGDDRCNEGGSIILCESQVLGERAAITGTPFALVYQSDRVPGRRSGDTLQIPLTGETLPAAVKRVDLTIDVAGRTFKVQRTPQAKDAYTFTFDGRDAYGRRVQGRQKIDVRIDYVYQAVYRTPATFASSFASVGGALLSTNGTRDEIAVGRRTSGVLGDGLQAPPSALAGWSLDVHHTYDPVGRTLYMGDGTKRSAEGQNFDVMATVKSGLEAPEDMVKTPDGSYLVADGHTIRRVSPSGVTTTIAGTGTAGFGGDGGPATQARLDHPAGVAVAADGAIYVADQGNNRIRRIAGGVITTVAGTGAGGYTGDGGPATSARLDEPTDVAAERGGAIVFIDRFNHAVRRVGPDGTISTLAGTGLAGFSGDDGLATRARLRFPRGLATTDDGTVYVADSGNHRVRRIGPDGVITTVAGDGETPFGGDGGQAAQAHLDTPAAVTPLPDGGLLIADSGHARLRKVAGDGTITTVAGNGTPGDRGDGGPAGQARIDFPAALAVGNDETIVFADESTGAIRSVAPSLPSLALGESTIPSPDGRQLFVFDANGRHLRTVDALTKGLVFEFGYDAAGRLTSVTDGDGQRTTIERAGNGTPARIVAPHGQATTLGVTNGYLSAIANPAGDTIAATYDEGGLLTELVDPRDGEHAFGYDSAGRLTSDRAPDGSTQTLTRTFADGVVTVTHRSGEGRTTTYRVERTEADEVKRTVTAGGRSTVTLIGADGVVDVSHSDGTQMTAELGPDPRFGMQSPVLTRATMTTPGGLRSAIDASRTVELEDPADPISVRRLTEITTVNGKTRTSRFDAATRTFTDTSPAGRTLTTTVDLLGRPTRVAAPGVTPATYAYSDGRLVSAGQGTRQETFSYDARGRVQSVTDALSRTTQFTYDLADRPATVTKPGGRTIAYAYDRNGNLTTVTPPGRTAHALAYDAREQLERYTPPSGAATTYGFDRDGLVTRAGDVSFTYDAAGRLAQVNGTEFTYAAATGRLTSAETAGDERVTYGYDGSLPTTVTSSGSAAGEVAFSYDADLRLASESVNGASTAYGYDDDGLLTQAGALTLTHDPANGLISSLAVAGVTTTVTRNAFGEPDTVSTPHYSETYGRDASGRITSKTVTRDGAPTTYEYGYDESDRLAEVKRDGTVEATYTYDANGNRDGADYDAQDRLIRRGDTTYTYTDAGALAKRTTGEAVTEYDYDALGALTRVKLPDKTIEYALDPGGRRVAVKRDGELQRGFLYGRGAGPVAELTPAGTVRSRFVYATRGNVPDYMVQGGTVYRIVTDQLGSPRAVIDTSTGEVAQELDYDAFGRVLRDTAPGFQPFGFGGGLYDADTGLVRFGERDYDPETGRFTAKDPLRFDGGDTNLYGYALADPVNFADPTGMWLDTLADIAFIGYDLYKIGRSLLNGCGVSGTDALALGADIAGAVIPFATGGGAAVRAGAHAADAAPVIKAGSRGGETAGKRFPESVKDAARAEDPTATCVYCGQSGTGTQVDHAIPRAQGGDATLDNAQLACPHCNASKGAGDYPKSPPPGYEGPWPPPHWPK